MKVRFLVLIGVLIAVVGIGAALPSVADAQTANAKAAARRFPAILGCVLLRSRNSPPQSLNVARSPRIAATPFLNVVSAILNRVDRVGPYELS